ncbi:P-loop containing nucleoside triphosphate hydrolase protein [Rhizopus microsporus var. microsporus]|uniref:DNA 3'-5' helicase n=1 Tax=Rhizopus microsporus var. microsporus TaxID=86635 RepID=A0A1X0R1S5_RHIZD|nr:P-loop containing nucleoside triphosphate hydrolase protein [Rhizopus microsporus var. microsporus]
MRDNSSSDDGIDRWLENEEAILSDSFDMLDIGQSVNQQYSSFNESNALHHNHNSLITQKNMQQQGQHRRNDTSCPVIGDTPLRHTADIPSPYNRIFKFGLFNVMQSKCLVDTFYENNNLVISAPTGSGKTVLLELSIIRALLNSGTDSKIIYMAPTKSLCNERAKDWEKKFKPFGIECKEYTGNTQNSTIASIHKTAIIVTTPEKWDSMTRRWVDHRKLMGLIKLILIDEVHILNEKRGAVLETCVSRMKTVNNQIRYIAVSATVPNLSDISTWLNAKPIAFSEEYRPVRLDRFVYGYPQKEDNMFLFDRKLDWKLVYDQMHSNGKPVLIFCSTRRSAQQACDTIANAMDKRKISTLCPNIQDYDKVNFKNKALARLFHKGIAFHHAGLDYADRTQVEELFLKKVIRVIGTTSTLALGVNLPAHLVIIKSTLGYQQGTLTEYSDIDLLQMIGRAGRPGLDTSGCAVIMTTNQMKQRYSSLVSGTTNLESRLHENLIEHLLSEICLGTIVNIRSAIEWLKSTFLYVRMSQNPLHYKIQQGISPASSLYADGILQNICVKHLESLEGHSMIEKMNNLLLKPTNYGLIMDKYYIKFSTMASIVNKKDISSLRDVLELVSSCQEEMETIRYNSGEKQFLNTIRNSPNIRYPLGKVTSVADKVFLVLQCILGDVNLHNSGNTLLATEGLNILNHASRITKCNGIIECAVYEWDSSKLKYSIQLYQSIQAKMWYDSPFVIRQITGIGPQFAKLLSEADLLSFEQLRKCDPSRIEMILHRNPPFGTQILRSLAAIPKLCLDVEQKIKGEDITLTFSIGATISRSTHTNANKGYYAQFWAETNEGALLDYRRIKVSQLHNSPEKFELTIPMTSSNMCVYCYLQSEEYVGTDVVKEITININTRRYIHISAPSDVHSSRQYQKQSAQESSTELMEEENLFDDGIDPELWKDFAVASTSTVFESKGPESASSDQHTANKYNFKRNSGLSTKAFKSSSKAVTPCRHKCKNKDECAHACCKIKPNTTNVEALHGKRKRISNESIFPAYEKQYKKPRQIAIPQYRQPFKRLNEGISENLDRISDETTMREADATFDIGSRGLELITRGIPEEDGIDISVFSFSSDVLMEDVESHLNGQELVAATGSPINHDTIDYEKEYSSINPVLHDDPIDDLWRETGRYVQQVYERTKYVNEKGSDDHEKSTVNTPNTIFQSKNLLDWIRNNVEIVHDGY